MIANREFERKELELRIETANEWWKGGSCGSLGHLGKDIWGVASS